MNIAFIVTFLKTKLFFEVSEKLKQNDVKTFWISPGDFYFINWLKGKGVNEEDFFIGSFNEKTEENYKELSKAKAEELEKLFRQSNTPVNNIILMDRILRTKPRNFAYNYIYFLYKNGKEFIKENNIEFIFAEPTFCIEIVFSIIAKEMGIKFLSPKMIRIPDGRFTFFEGYLESKFATEFTPSEENKIEAENFYEYFKAKEPKPKYFYINQKLMKPEASWIRKFVYHTKYFLKEDEIDQTRFPIKQLVKERAKQVYYTSRIKVNEPFEQPKQDDEKFVLFTFHKQPEASVDVLGAFYSDQAELIRKISRSLPITHKLYLKEHSNAIGDRGINYYKELKKLQNVRLIDPYSNAFDLIKKADAVIAISGTVTYEAGLLGIPAINFSDMFFNDLPRIFRCGNVEELNPIISKCIKLKNTPLTDEEKVRTIKYLTNLYANSFTGTISDERSDPECMSEENIKNVTKGFTRILK